MALYTLPELPYDYAALAPVISPEIIELHHDKHHAAYVKGANDTLEQLAEARDKDAWGAVNGLEKNLAFHLSGHILHSIYWQNMTGPKEGGGEPLARDGVGTWPTRSRSPSAPSPVSRPSCPRPPPPHRDRAGACSRTSRSAGG